MTRSVSVHSIDVHASHCAGPMSSRFQPRWEENGRSLCNNKRVRGADIVEHRAVVRRARRTQAQSRAMRRRGVLLVWAARAMMSHDCRVDTDRYTGAVRGESGESGESFAWRLSRDALLRPPPPLGPTSGWGHSACLFVGGARDGVKRGSTLYARANGFLSHSLLALPSLSMRVQNGSVTAHAGFSSVVAWRPE